MHKIQRTNNRAKRTLLHECISLPFATVTKRSPSVRGQNIFPNIFGKCAPILTMFGRQQFKWRRNTAVSVCC